MTGKELARLQRDIASIIEAGDVVEERRHEATAAAVISHIEPLLRLADATRAAILATTATREAQAAVDRLVEP